MIEEEKESHELGSRSESRSDDLLRDGDADRSDSIGVLQERSKLGEHSSSDVAGDLWSESELVSAREGSSGGRRDGTNRSVKRRAVGLETVGFLVGRSRDGSVSWEKEEEEVQFNSKSRRAEEEAITHVENWLRSRPNVEAEESRRMTSKRERLTCRRVWCRYPEQPQEFSPAFLRVVAAEKTPTHLKISSQPLVLESARARDLLSKSRQTSMRKEKIN